MKINLFCSDRKFVALVLSLFLAALTSYKKVSADINHPDHSNMILLMAGCFQMGSEEFVSEEPVHKVCVSSFYLDKFEATQKSFSLTKGIII
jgi:formylglycine-generating enzyme required for sulfatase activity